MQIRTSAQTTAARYLERFGSLKRQGVEPQQLAQEADSFLSESATAAAAEDAGAETYFASNALSVSRGFAGSPQTRLNCLEGALGLLAKGVAGPAGLALSQLGAEVLSSGNNHSDTEAATQLLRRASADESLSSNSLGVARRTLKIIDQIDLEEGSQEIVLASGFRSVESGYEHPANFTQSVAAELLGHAPFDAGEITMLR